MIIRVKGGSGGICDYLEFGRKNGRSESRDELDQRLPLSGQLKVVDQILQSFDLEESTQKYFHITLSFKESAIDENILQQIDNDFQKFIFTACKSDEFYYYSEAHLPKIQKAIDINGNEYERFPHIHVVIPQFNLYTGKRDEPFGLIDNIKHYINSFQELINEKYQLESPKDNIRQLSFGKEEILNRYKIDADMSIKETKEKIFALVRDHPHISSVEALAEVIRPFGEVRVRDSKKFGTKYLNIVILGREKGINLKDAVFLDNYLATRDASVTHAFVSAEHEALLAKWKAYGALEARFVPASSRKQRQAYAAMGVEDKKAWLRARWKAHESMLASLEPESRPVQIPVAMPLVAPQLLRPHVEAIPSVEDLPHIDDIRHIDDVPHVTDLPNFDEQVLEDNYEQQHSSRAGEFNMHDVRVRGGHGGSRTGGDVSEADLLPDDKRADMVGNEEIPTTDLYALPAKIGNSVAAGIRDRLTGQHEKSAWSALINAIDARSLLDYLQYHYRIDADAERLGIERVQSGAERIVDGNRRYSPSDFLTRRMHLTWPEARQVLQTVYDGQQRGEWRERAVTSKIMWARFERYEQRLPGMASVARQYKAKRDALRLAHTFMPDPTQSKAQNAVRRRLLRENRRAEMARLREAFEAEMRYYRLRPHERYLDYLYDMAEGGDRAALGELNRIYPFREHDSGRQVFEIRIREQVRPLSQFIPAEMGYSVKIKRNGTVEYQNGRDEVVIVDAYSSIKVRERSEDTIANALALAKLRYGVSGFEIRNAKPEDLPAIRAAVEKSGVQVTVLPGKADSPARHER